MNERSIEVPILLLTYNRIDTVQRVFEVIKKVKPQKLYLASDGPRENKPNDREKILAVRQWMDQNVDWECQVFRRYAEVNAGCQKGVSAAISWIFEKEEEAIILEDDIVPDQSFFCFCQEMLHRYKDDKRVMLVSGYKEKEYIEHEKDYFFSPFSSIWGWGTWKRAWELFDIDMKEWPALQEKGFLLNLYGRGVDFRLGKVFDKVYNKEMDSWAYAWLFATLLNSGLGVVPKVNLINNIGMEREDATHTKGKMGCNPSGCLEFPIRYEEHVLTNWDYDTFYKNKHFKINWAKELLRPLIPKKILSQWYRFRGVS